MYGLQECHESIWYDIYCKEDKQDKLHTTKPNTTSDAIQLEQTGIWMWD